ncbi:MAG TPA: hypothetical protein V6C99_03005 [Oculatellaceae cyanobacterium]
MRLFPITANLNPFSGARFWMYLIYSTALARLLTGFARVYQNRPSAQAPSLSENEKRQACLERFFVEIIGTTGYLVSLHLGQDVIGKLMQPGLKKEFDALLRKIDDSALSGLNAEQARRVKNTLTTVYGDGSHNFIARYLYESFKTPDGKNDKVALNQVRGLLNDDALFTHVRSSVPLDVFIGKLRHRAAGTVFGGIFASALFGGLVVQWMNDRVFAPAVRRAIDKRSFKPLDAQLAGMPVMAQAPTLGVASFSPKPTSMPSTQANTPLSTYSYYSVFPSRPGGSLVGGVLR